MISYYANTGSYVFECQEKDEFNWINVVNPTEEEIDKLHHKYDIPHDFLQAALDIEEKSRVEIEDGIKLIIVDIPVVDDDVPEYEAYSTVPLGIIVTKQVIITICLINTSIIDEICKNKVRNIALSFKTRFVFQILIRVATRYLFYLKQIEKISSNIERKLNKNLKNEELLQLLALAKSLIYFSASLKSNETTLKKMLRGHILKLYEEDRDLLEDSIIEVSQAIEMASSYSTIIKATMETYSSVASNNLNVTMKVLAVITIIMSFPNIVFGFYGMNISKLPLSEYFVVPLLLSGVGSILLWFMIRRAKFYK